MLTMYRRLTNILLPLAWASAVALSIYAWKSDRAVFGYNARHELVLPSGAHRPIQQTEIKPLADHPGGGTVRVRHISADRWRGSIAITASSMTYQVINHAALNSYYEDNGSPDSNPFQNYGDAISRGFYRFPLSLDRSVVWDIVPQLPSPDYKPHYTFVRTHDPYRTGWDLELRVPFWIIWAALSLPPLCYIATKGFRRVRRRARRLQRRCERCNYDLRASQERCPECNHPIPAA